MRPGKSISKRLKDLVMIIHSLLLGFAHAETLESRRAFDEAHEVYNSLLDRYHTLISQSSNLRDAEIQNATEQAQSNSGVSTAQLEGEQTLAEMVAQMREAITERCRPGMEALKSAAASVWIAQMRFARRAEVCTSPEHSS